MQFGSLSSQNNLDFHDETFVRFTEIWLIGATWSSKMWYKLLKNSSTRNYMEHNNIFSWCQQDYLLYYQYDTISVEFLLDKATSMLEWYNLSTEVGRFKTSVPLVGSKAYLVLHAGQVSSEYFKDHIK